MLVEDELPVGVTVEVGVFESLGDMETLGVIDGLAPTLNEDVGVAVRLVLLDAVGEGVPELLLVAVAVGDDVPVGDGVTLCDPEDVTDELLVALPD